MEKNLTTGSVGRNLLFFSLPYLLSYFLQTVLDIRDELATQLEQIFDCKTIVGLADAKNPEMEL